MGRTIKKVMALVTVSLLLLVAACAPTPGAVTPTPEDSVSTPTPEGVTPPSAPGSTSVPGITSVPAPVDNDNFRLLISDEKNAIGDFESLVVTISGVGVHLAGESGGWLEFALATEELDLVNLQGENAEEIWSGNLTAGQYTKVFIYVSDIEAVLSNGVSDNATPEIKLPSDKLQINTNFSIPEDSPVSFVFDISVVATGNEKSGISYILKPVISQSGPNQKFTEVDSQARDRDRDREREEEGRFDLELEGDIVPGETVTLLVTFHDEPVEGATVEVNDEEIGVTGEDGTISFTIPEDAEELDIDVTKGETRGELEYEFEQEAEGESEQELEGDLVLEITEGDIAPGETVTLLVTFQDEPVEGAMITVNDDNIGQTDEDGTISFTVPEDAEGLSIEAKLGGRQGEMEIEFQEE